MKDCCNQPVKKSIDRIRQELNKLVESGNVSSDIVNRTSCELDELIALYYKTLDQQKKCTRSTN